jgi:hypothetical protein
MCCAADGRDESGIFLLDSSLRGIFLNNIKLVVARQDEAFSFHQPRQTAFAVYIVHITTFFAHSSSSQLEQR